MTSAWAIRTGRDLFVRGSKQQVYSARFTTVGDQTYYAVLAADRGDSIRSFFTYEASYPGKLKRSTSLCIDPVHQDGIAQRALVFDYKGATIKLNCPMIAAGGIPRARSRNRNSNSTSIPDGSTQ